MSTYAVVKVDRTTGDVVAVLARGMLFHHADKFAADVSRNGTVQDGFYLTARNENDLQVKDPAA